MSDIENHNVHEQVKDYCRLGLHPVPVVFRQKYPVRKDWTTLEITEDTVPTYFCDNKQNSGLRHENTADLDCDFLEAVIAARFLAPKTNWKFGHASKRDSHSIYTVEEKVCSEEYRDPTANKREKSMVVEIIGLKKDGTPGNQTVVPPSVHESGEPIEWSPDADPSRPPAVVDANELRNAARLIAAIALLAHHFPDSGQGRHPCMMAFAGTLARAGILEEEAEQWCLILYQSVLTHDPDKLDRVRGEVSDTYEKYRANQPITGYSTLKPFFNSKVLKKALEWLGVRGAEEEESLTVQTDGRPVLQMDNRDLRDKSHDVLDVLHSNNAPPVLFRRRGSTVRYMVEDDTPKILRVNEALLVSRMTDVASFRRGCKIVDPPGNVAADVLLRLLSDERFPELRGISATPIFRPDGTICTTPGYDPQTKLIYVPPAGFSMPPVPENPTAEDVQEAVRRLRDVICDFPFETDADRANAIGLMLIAVLRPAIRSNNPFFLLTATKERTGKGLLVDVVSILATGTRAKIRPVPKGDWNPEITTALQDSPILVIFDNLPKGTVLNSDDLCVLSTGDVWVARKYHTNDKQHELPVTGTWIFTGNVIEVGGEIPARCIRIALDAKMSEPQLRTGWKHNPLLAFVEASRGDLLWSILALARSWFVAGMPKPTTVAPLGNFEEITSMIGGILEHAGVKDFRGNESTIRKMDRDNTQFEAFLRALAEVFGNNAFLPIDVDNQMKIKRDLLNAIPDCLKEGMEKTGTFTRRLGKLLTSRNGTRYGNRNVYVESSPCGNATKYCIRLGAESAGDGIQRLGSKESATPQQLRPQKPNKTEEEIQAEVDAIFEALL